MNMENTVYISKVGQIFIRLTLNTTAFENWKKNSVMQ